jgi:hypothetical protein
MQEIIDKKVDNEVVSSYSIGRYLGRGHTSQCYEIRSLKSDTSYACKVVEKAYLSDLRRLNRVFYQFQVRY